MTGLIFQNFLNFWIKIIISEVAQILEEAKNDKNKDEFLGFMVIAY